MIELAALVLEFVKPMMHSIDSMARPDRCMLHTSSRNACLETGAVDSETQLAFTQDYLDSKGVQQAHKNRTLRSDKKGLKHMLSKLVSMP